MKQVIDTQIEALRNAVLTPRGSIPHKPDYGSSLHEYIDRPINKVLPLVIGEIHRVADAVLGPGFSVAAVKSVGPGGSWQGFRALITVRHDSGTEQTLELPL